MTDVEIYADGVNALNSWYKEDEGSVYSTLVAVVRMLDSNQKYLNLKNLDNYRLYGDIPSTYASGMMFSSMMRDDQNRQSIFGQDRRLTLNVVKSCVDTVVSKMCKDKVKPTFLTSGGKWIQQQKAKELQKFVDGVFYEGGIYEVEYDVFLNTCIFGTGVMKVFSDYDSGKICFENVLTDELQVDELDGYYRKPRNLYQRKWVDRNQLAALYPKKKAQILAAPKVYSGLATTLADLVLVVEGWRLPSGENTKDGRHVIVCETADLFDEVWDRKTFPFVFNRWTTMPVGFFGQGIPDELRGIQLEIDRLLRYIQESMRLLSSPKMLVQNGQDIVIEHLNNQIGAIIRHSGQPPQVIAPQVIAPDIFRQLDSLYSRAYEIVGVSQLSANSQKPGGLDSGKALREFNDIQTERFVIQGRKREQFFVDAAELVLEEARALASSDKMTTVKVFSKNEGVQYINFKDVDVEKDDYVMQVFPSSALPSSPAFRLQTVQEMIQGGLIPPEQAAELLDFPDLQSYQSLANADLNNILRILSNIIDKGKYEQPEPFTNLALGKKLGLQFYNKAQIDEVPESRLSLIRLFLQDVDTWTQQAQAPQGQPAAQEQAQIGAMPTAPLPTQTLAPGLTQ